jgi:hypothetical protein
MEDQQSVLFSLGIDDITQSHFTSIAKWNRFLAIVGIVISFLVILLLLFGSAYFSYIFSSFGGPNQPTANAGDFFTVFIVVYIILIAVYLIPCFFRLSFSNKMLRAIANNDQQILNESLGHLKTFSKYWGIVTIIIITIYTLIFIFSILASIMR